MLFNSNLHNQGLLSLISYNHDSRLDLTFEPFSRFYGIQIQVTIFTTTFFTICSIAQFTSRFTTVKMKGITSIQGASRFYHFLDKNYGQHANSPFKSPLIGLCTCLCSRDRRPPYRLWQPRPSFKLPLPRLWSLSNGENPGINIACPIKLSPYK